jgi:integrase
MATMTAVDTPALFSLTSVSITEAVRRARHMGRRKKHVSTNSFYSLCQDFKRSAKFLSYERATQRLWGRELDFACRDDILGAASLDEIRPALIQGYLDGWSDKPGKQAAALAAFHALERWAIVRDLLSRSITLGVETGKPTGGHLPWTDEQVALAERWARTDLARTVVLAANTGQRGSDLVRMGPTDIETFNGREGIRVVQKKTGREVWVPILEPLRKAMESWERRPGPFLLTRWGDPWTRQQLTNAWTYERDTNNNLRPLREAGLVLHGLRGHACVRLYRAGCTTRQVADMVGMSEPMVARYTRLSVQKENALAAVYQLETFRERAVKDGNDG